MTELDNLRARQEALETANDTLHEAFRSVDGDAHTALEVAKQNVRLMTSLRATQLEHGRALGALTTEVAELKSDVGTLKSDVGTLKSDVGTLKSDVGTLKIGVDELRNGLTEVLRRLPG